jgi:hypothetical protein
VGNHPHFTYPHHLIVSSCTTNSTFANSIKLKQLYQKTIFRTWWGAEGHFYAALTVLRQQLASILWSPFYQKHCIESSKFYIHVTVHRNRFLFKQPTTRNNYPNLFCYKTLHVSGIFSAHHQEFSTVLSALLSFINASGWLFKKKSSKFSHKAFSTHFMGMSVFDSFIKAEISCIVSLCPAKIWNNL